MLCYYIIRHYKASTLQGLGHPDFHNIESLLKGMGAIQGQEYKMAKWAIGLRLRTENALTIKAAFEKGDVLRPHISDQRRFQ